MTYEELEAKVQEQEKQILELKEPRPNEEFGFLEQRVTLLEGEDSKSRDKIATLEGLVAQLDEIILKNPGFFPLIDLEVKEETEE